MLDRWIVGNADRISPEAPVPVLLEESQHFSIGGAGNLALNIQSINGQVNLFGSVGQDKEGEEKSEESNNLVYYCRNCGNNESNIIETICVSKTQIKRLEEKMISGINEFTKLDPTLPRVNNIPCPNLKCTTNSETNPEDKEVIYLKYDQKNMDYIYMCCRCQQSWITVGMDNTVQMICPEVNESPEIEA